MSKSKFEQKLPVTFKEKWVEALRSGDYKQTTGTLVEQDKKNGSSYCCLGVACAVAGLTDKQMCGLGVMSTQHINTLKKKKRAYKAVEIIANDDKISDTLISLNDDKGKSFKYIASYIERYL